MLFKKIRILAVLFLLTGFVKGQILTQEEIADTSKTPRTPKSSEEFALPDAPPAEQQVVLALSTSMPAKKAEKLFQDKSFSEAIPYFIKALSIDSTHIDLQNKLAECYRLTNNVPGQIKIYGQLIRQGHAKPIQELYYGQALVQNGDLEKAKPYFEKYSADPRGKSLLASYSKLKTYSRNADAYALAPASFNTSYNDLCAVKFDSVTVFTSTRPINKLIERNQGWTGSDYMNVFATKKDQKGLELSPKQFLKDLDTKFNDGPVCFNKGMYLIYYTSNHALKIDKAHDGNFKLRILEGEIEENGLTKVTQPAFINKEYNYAHPSINVAGNVLYFSSDQDGGLGGMDIYKSEKDSAGIWGPAINLGATINTAGNDVFPFIASNGNLFFSSNGHDGLGGLDIYEVSFRNNKALRVYNMGEPINSRYDDFGLFLVDDMKSGYISSNRKAGGLDDDIYELQILREIKRGKDVLVITRDKISGNIVPNVRILFDKDTVFTDTNGEYTALVDEESVFKVKMLKEDCFELKDTISARSTKEDSIVKVFLLENNPKLYLHGTVTDAKTNQPLQNVNIRVTDIESTQDLDRYITTADGDYFKFLFDSRIGDKLAYLIKLEKTGYLSRSVVLNYQIEKGGEIDLNQIINLQLGQVEVGMDLGKLIDLKPIYFDVGKASIRPDAAIELDKIVEVMNQYPNMFIELGSHTDCRGSAAKNLILSTARAKSSVDYIVKQGINKLRITAKGYGETKLLNDCGCEGKVLSTCSEEQHALNRRTEFVITRLN